MSDTILSRLRAPQGVVDAVLDTDTFNEIDDQFALSYMLRSTERINTRAIYAAPFFNENSSSPEDGMLKSYEEIKTLLKLANREDLIPCAFEGSRRYLPDEKTPVDSPAARVLFASGAAIVQLPCMGVVDRFTLTEPELHYWLLGKSALCDHLANATIEAAHRYAKGKPWSRVIWDVTAVSWLLNDNDRFMNSRVIPAPIPQYDHHYSLDPRRAPLRYVWNIKRDALMADLIAKLTK